MAVREVVAADLRELLEELQPYSAYRFAPGERPSTDITEEVVDYTMRRYCQLMEIRTTFLHGDISFAEWKRRSDNKHGEILDETTFVINDGSERLLSHVRSRSILQRRAGE